MNEWGRGIARSHAWLPDDIAYNIMRHFCGMKAFLRLLQVARWHKDMQATQRLLARCAALREELLLRFQPLLVSNIKCPLCARPLTMKLIFGCDLLDKPASTEFPSPLIKWRIMNARPKDRANPEILTDPVMNLLKRARVSTSNIDIVRAFVSVVATHYLPYEVFFLKSLLSQCSHGSWSANGGRHRATVSFTLYSVDAVLVFQDC